MKVIELLLDMIVSILGSIFSGTYEILESFSIPKQQTEYSAEFGEIQEQFQRRPSGMRIGYRWGNTVQESHEHLITFGGSGSKKSSCIGFSTLLQSNESSYVVFDCAKEYLKGTSGYKHQQGYKVFKLDYDDFANSIGFNYLDKCHTETDIYAGAQIIFKNASYEARGDYWTQSGENLVGLFAYLLKQYAPAYANLPNVLHMIQTFSFSGKRIDDWMAKHCRDLKILNKYRSLVATPEKTLQSTIAMATNALSIYSAPNIAAITSCDTLPFDTFRKEKTILYVCGSPASSQFARAVSATFFEAFFSYILQAPPELDALPITYIIDEANTMHLGMLPKILELGRKYRISISSLWQDISQIEHRYGKLSSDVLANSKLKVFMGGSGHPLSTCQMLQSLLGKYSYTDESGIQRSRELLTAQEIFQLKDILVLNGNNKPLLVKPRPYFENSKLLRHSQLPPYDFSGTPPLSEPKLLQF